MMLRGNLEKVILVAIICAAVLYLIIPVDFALKGEPRSLAFIPHEDPETTEQVFSGIPSFMFDSDYLNLVLQMDPEKVKAMLRERSFRSISQNLKQAVNDFDASRVYISNMLVEIYEDLEKLKTLVGQHRFDEGTRLADETYAKLSQANIEIKLIEEAAKTTSRRFMIPLAPPESNLRRSYDALMERIDAGRETLDLDKDILASFSKTLAGELLNLTEVTLKIEPTVAFVGDNIDIAGVLTSEKEPLAAREIYILLNSSRYVTTRTYGRGYYRGMLQVPYQYTPELHLQALYYPRDKDIGLYLASLSPVIKLKVLFYETELQVAVEDKAFPGLETTVTGRFDYGQSPALNERKIEIYFDDVLVTEAIAQETFAQEIRIDPQAETGKHTITVSAAPVGKYSPVVASAILNVTGVNTVNTILDVNIPKAAMIPGSIGLSGKLYSEVGPLRGASIKIGLGKSQVELVSSKDGTFDTEIKAGMGFGLIGSQDLVVQVVPQEPWHNPLNITRSILIVNVVNCGAFVAVLLFLGIYLPGRLRRRLGAYPRRTARPAIATDQPDLAPAYSEGVTVLTSTEEGKEISSEPRSRIFYWYRLVVRLIQGITKALLRPQQTLREFAQESSRVLEPAAKYFIELTKTVERLLYSQYRPTEKDVENSKQLSHKIEGETKLRVTTQPLLPGRVLTTGPWRQLSTWLWLLLILAVAWYACILLFVLPLLLMSLAYCLPMVIVDDLRERGNQGSHQGGTKG